MGHATWATSAITFTLAWETLPRYCGNGKGKDNWQGGNGKGKDNGKGKGKGKGNGKGGKGHMLPRTRISEEPFGGTVAEWKGKYGWIVPGEPIPHEKAQLNNGRLFFS